MNVYGGFQLGEFQNDFETVPTIVDIGPSVITFLPVSSRNQVTEGSDYYLTIAYFDVFGNPFTPLTVQWRVWDDTNKAVLQPWTQYSPSGNSDTLHILSTYNMLGNQNNSTEIRKAVFMISSAAGAQRYDDASYSINALDDASLT